jgi:hypothetical protein
MTGGEQVVARGRGRTAKLLAERFHSRDSGRARHWYQGTGTSYVRGEPARAAARAAGWAEARAVLPSPLAREAAGGNETMTLLAGLRARLLTVYSFERCPDCDRPGWAHPANAAASPDAGGCERRRP